MKPIFETRDGCVIPVHGHVRKVHCIELAETKNIFLGSFDGLNHMPSRLVAFIQTTVSVQSNKVLLQLLGRRLNP